MSVAGYRTKKKKKVKGDRSPDAVCGQAGFSGLTTAEGAVPVTEEPAGPAEEAGTEEGEIAATAGDSQAESDSSRILKVRFPQFKIKRKKAAAALQDTGVVPEEATDKKPPTEGREPQQQDVPLNSQSSSSLASAKSDFTRLLQEYVVHYSQRACVESSTGYRPASHSRCSSPLMSDGDNADFADFDVDAEVEQEERYHRRYGPSSDDSAGDDSDADVVPILPPASPARKRPRYRQPPPSRPGAAEPVVAPAKSE